MNTEFKVLIAEDETPLRQSFERVLADAWPDAHLVASCSDGLEAIDAFHRYQPNIAFLDIRMPGANGLEVAKAIGQNCFVVFTTAYDEYAVAAFESGAVDYLLKPIEFSRLTATIERLRQRAQQQLPQDLSSLIDELQAKISPQNESLKWVTAAVGDTLKMIAVDDIIYLCSDSKYTKVVTQKQEALLRMPLKTLGEKLDAQQFWRVHRSAIVAADQIDTLTKNELGHWQLSLKSRDERLPVSAEFRKKLKAL